MKKSFLFLVLLAMGIMISAQTPNSFNYQAIIRNIDGEVLAEEKVAMKFSLLTDSSAGESVYHEEHQLVTSPAGLITVAIGNGTNASVSMDSIDWQNHPHFLKVEFKRESESSYHHLGTARLLSVPYAMHAATADALAKPVEFEMKRHVMVTSEDTVSDNRAFHFDISKDNVQRGLQVDMSGQGTKFALRGNTHADSTDDGFKIGVLGSSMGSGSGNVEGVRGQAFSNGKYNTGVLGLAGGAGNGDTGLPGSGEMGSYNTGVSGQAHSNAWGNTGVYGSTGGSVGEDNIGVAGHSSVGDSGNTSIENKGVLGWGRGPGKNFGVYGIAGDDGVENWAGWFDGDVKVTGNLSVEGELNKSFNDAMGKSYKVTNDNGQLRANLNYYANNDAGSLVLRGAHDTTTAILGSTYQGYAGGLWLYDSTRNNTVRLQSLKNGGGRLLTYDENGNNIAWFGNYRPNSGIFQITAYDENSQLLGAVGSYINQNKPEMYLETAVEGNYKTIVSLGGNEVGEQGIGGYLTLRGPAPDKDTWPNDVFSVMAVSDQNGSDPEGFSGEAFFRGTHTPNLQMGGKPWEDNDLGFFQMFGSIQNADDWYTPAILMEVGKNESDASEAGFVSFRRILSADSSRETIAMHGHDGSATFSGRLDAYDLWANGGKFHAIGSDLALGEGAALGVKKWDNNGNLGFIHMRGGTDFGTEPWGAGKLLVALETEQQDTLQYARLHLGKTSASGEFEESIKLNSYSGSVEAQTVNVKEVLNLKPTSDAPANPVDGDMYFDSNEGKVKIYVAGAWKTLAFE